MRTTCIFIGMTIVCLAFLVFIKTKKGKEWLDKID
jgi:hypothetical protein